MSRHKRNHRRKKKSTFKPLTMFLIIACIIAGIAVFFNLKDNHINFWSTKTEQKSSSNKSKDSSDVTSSELTTKSSSSKSTDSSKVNWVKQKAAISFPILMYHAIHVMAAEESANANLIVDPTTFESHIKRLSDEGYYFLSPDEAYKVLTENVLPNDNSKVVWLTFDDGNWDFYDNAYPILKKYQAKATNNVITGIVDNAANLSLNEMVEMKKNGMFFEDHTVNHPDLSAADSATQTTEMKDSKTYLDTKLKQDTIAIAYPSGRYTDTTTQIAESLGYKLGVTTKEGLASASDGLLSLNRVRILPTTTADTLIATITQ